MTRFLPGLAVLSRYDRSWLRYDLVAGVSVAAVAVPIAIAYSQLAGVPPAHGLYASILPLVAYALLGSSRQLIMAPDAATCAIVAATVAPLAAQDPGRYVSLTMMLAIVTGVFCIVAGVAGLGFLTNFLARPILTGYLNGIALSIISGQLGRLFGFSLEPAGFFRLVAAFISSVGRTHVLTLALGLGTFVLLRILKRVAPKVPGPLVAVAVGIGASSLFRFGDHSVALLGTIPAGLPAPMIPDVGLGDLGPLALGAVGLALISFNSAMVTARSFAVKNRYEIDSNQEFIALGAADIGAGLLQGFAVSGADSRTAVNDSVGGKSQVTGLVAAGLLVLVLLFLTGPLALLSITVLPAVLINAALGLFDLQSLSRLRQVSPQEFRLSMITLLGVDHCRCTAGSPGRGRPGAAAVAGQGLAPSRCRARACAEHRRFPRHHHPSRGRHRPRSRDLPLRRVAGLLQRRLLQEQGPGRRRRVACKGALRFAGCRDHSLCRHDGRSQPRGGQPGTGGPRHRAGHRLGQGTGPAHARSHRTDAADGRRTPVPDAGISRRVSSFGDAVARYHRRDVVARMPLNCEGDERAAMFVRRARHTQLVGDEVLVDDVGEAVRAQ